MGFAVEVTDECRYLTADRAPVARAIALGRQTCHVDYFQQGGEADTEIDPRSEMMLGDDHTRDGLPVGELLLDRLPSGDPLWQAVTGKQPIEVGENIHLFVVRCRLICDIQDQALRVLAAVAVIHGAATYYNRLSGEFNPNYCWRTSYPRVAPPTGFANNALTDGSCVA